MTTVLRTLLDTFFVEYMNVRSLKGSCLTHNKASKRVLEKCGFVFENEESDVFEVAESKTGIKESIGQGRSHEVNRDTEMRGVT
ncbi:hypothetical protein UCDDS831_g03192 [Diplodia seriata]|uniref:N-acetyltransferase domain-containing protein n=1 Tax=Diplodia seriata TaxID=420778 RepID=A0A0G2EJR1_9PEZI|nr:hypothetical protein UCDDS831_g03192 [Diplodia seriata]